MPPIRFICLSDLHFGDTASLLTTLNEFGDAEPTRPNDALTHLVRCLRALLAQQEGEAPTLVLAGDTLEFALAPDHIALMAFEQFLKLIAPEGEAPLFSRIVFMPGNHDHHIWETAREAQYARHLLRVAPNTVLPAPWHTTSLVLDDRHRGVRSELLDNLLHHRVRATHPAITVVYPNYGAFSVNGERGVVFSHAHYIEPIYTLVSQARQRLFPDARMPDRIYELEQENFAWIDFFWSMLGRQGDAGRDVDRVYKSLRDPERTEQYIANLSKSLAADVHLPLVPEFMEPGVFKLVFKRLLELALRSERTQREARKDEPIKLGDGSRKGLQTYVERQLREQILQEHGQMPLAMSLVIGHTHKPFSVATRFQGFPTEVPVYNAGGWVVEDKADPEHGAAIVVVDDALDVASIEVFRDAPESAPTLASLVPEDREQTVSQNALRGQIEALLTEHPEPWKALASAAAEAITKRRGRPKSPEARGVEAYD